MFLNIPIKNSFIQIKFLTYQKMIIMTPLLKLLLFLKLFQPHKLNLYAIHHLQLMIYLILNLIPLLKIFLDNLYIIGLKTGMCLIQSQSLWKLLILYMLWLMKNILVLKILRKILWLNLLSLLKMLQMFLKIVECLLIELFFLIMEIDLGLPLWILLR